MASVGLDFTQITPDNGAVREISRLIFKDVLQAERIGSLLNVMRGVFNGDKVGIVGEFGLLGTANTGCNPECNTEYNTECNIEYSAGYRRYIPDYSDCSDCYSRSSTGGIQPAQEKKTFVK